MVGGKFLGGSIKTSLGDLGAYDIVNSDYLLLKRIFNRIQLHDNDVFIDVGCGKGRVLNFLCLQRFKGRIYGIELDKTIAEFTQNRLRKTKNVSVIYGNVLEILPNDATVCYMYHPFNKTILEKLLNKIETFDHPVTCIYGTHAATSDLISMMPRENWRLEDSFETQYYKKCFQTSVAKFTPPTYRSL